MKRLRPIVWLAVLALLAPGLVAALPACVSEDHCAIGAIRGMDGMDGMHGMDGMGAMGATEKPAPDCHGATIGAGDCCLDKAPVSAAAERPGTAPVATAAPRTDPAAAPRPALERESVLRAGEGLSPPLSTRFQALLI